MDYEVVKAAKEEIEEFSESQDDVFIGEEVVQNIQEELEEKSAEGKKPKKRKKP